MVLFYNFFFAEIFNFLFLSRELVILITQLASGRARISKKQSGIDCIIGAYFFCPWSYDFTVLLSKKVECISPSLPSG